jgi:hypothetical protein
MRNEYFSHLRLICCCYSTNGRQEQRAPLRVTRYQEREAREQSEPGGKKLALQNPQGSSFPWRAVPEMNLRETFAPCVSEMEKADNTCFISRHLT